MQKTLYLASSNAQKQEDVKRIFQDSASPPLALEMKIVEVLSSELREVVREKAKYAYERALVPLIVEHGALHVEHLRGLPGPMVKLFWEKLGDGLCDVIPPGASREARVVQMVCYCDGRSFRIFEGEVRGTIALKRAGSRGIHWEPMFIPAGHHKTYGEMEPDERISLHASTRAYAALRVELGL